MSDDDDGFEADIDHVLAKNDELYRRLGRDTGEGTMNTNVAIGRRELLSALRQMTLDNIDFDHRQWSLADALDLERAGALIRKGYRTEVADDDASPADVEIVRGQGREKWWRIWMTRNNGNTLPYCVEAITSISDDPKFRREFATLDEAMACYREEKSR